MQNIEPRLISCFSKSEANKTIKKRDKINSITHNLEAYKKILLATKKLSQELNLTNSLELSNLYSYLLWNGYFSKNNSLKYQSKGRIVIPGMYSQDIMLGIGTCLNFSDMLTDFLNEFEFSSATLISIGFTNVIRDYAVKVRRTISNNDCVDTNINKTRITFFQKITGTHAFNLIKDNDKYYIYDSTNLCSFKINSHKKATTILGKGEVDLKPYTSYAYNFNDKSISMLDEFNNSKNIQSITDDNEFKETWEYCLEIIKNNYKLLEDFYKEINDDITKIYKANDNYYFDIQDVIRTKIR